MLCLGSFHQLVDFHHQQPYTNNMMKQQRTQSTDRKNNAPRHRVVHQKNFEIDLDPNLASDLGFFIQQELLYYNSLVENLTPRLRAYPKDLMSIKDREKSLWDACAEHAINPQKLIDNPLETWPKHLVYMHKILYDTANQIKVTPSLINICAVAAAPARLHANVRKAMASEVLKYMIGQSDILLAAMKTDTMRAPMQMLQTHNIDSKRHLQIPKSLVKISYDPETNASSISNPYCRKPFVIPGLDLREIVYRMLIIRAPHPSANTQRWQVDFKEAQTGYLLNLTDHVERKRRG
jgi:hypothetical protein